LLKSEGKWAWPFARTRGRLSAHKEKVALAKPLVN